MADDQLIAETTPKGILLRPAVTLPLARIFHHDGVQRARQRDGWARGMPRQGLTAPARQTVWLDARCRDALNVECFCHVQNGFPRNDDFSMEKTLQKHVHGEISGLEIYSTQRLAEFDAAEEELAGVLQHAAF